MPIGVIFEFPGATSRAKYEKSVRLILKGRRKRLADWPVKGVLAHIAGPMPGGWCVIDVWRSRAAFNRFGKKLSWPPWNGRRQSGMNFGGICGHSETLSRDFDNAAKHKLTQ